MRVMHVIRLLSFFVALLLISCGRPFLYPNEAKTADGKPVAAETEVESKARLEVPPDLRGKIEVPESPTVQAEPDETTAVTGERVAGEAVSLNARAYFRPAANVFSAVVDAMTALNKPVQSVDSASGTITTDWVRSDSDNPNAVFGGLFGGGPTHTRYRYVVRVFDEGEQTRLEIRTLGQVFMNKHWVNKPIRRGVAEELFVATEEQLLR
ncbi:MAG: outer membrane protein assembly factor BamC [Mariprofundaceae bacterium]